MEGHRTYSTPPTEAEKGRSTDTDLCCRSFVYQTTEIFDNIMYKPKQLGSVFIEICNKNIRNIVIGCIYKHPSVELNELNETFLDPLMEELPAKDKSLYLMGDFNIDLMKMDSDNHTSTFFDSMTSNLFVPHLIYPTRMTSTTKTLIDNMFSNSPHFLQGISGNPTISVSDHLAQFLIIPEENQKSPENINLYRDIKNFDRESFILY